MQDENSHSTPASTSGLYSRSENREQQDSTPGLRRRKQARDDFDRARQAMLRAFICFIDQVGSRQEAEGEAEATANVLRQIIDLEHEARTPFSDGGWVVRPSPDAMVFWRHVDEWLPPHRGKKP